MMLNPNCKGYGRIDEVWLWTETDEDGDEDVVMNASPRHLFMFHTEEHARSSRDVARACAGAGHVVCLVRLTRSSEELVRGPQE